MTLTFKAKSLSNKIFTSVLAFTLGIVVVLAVVLTSIYYSSYENEAEHMLAVEAQEAAAYLNDGVDDELLMRTVASIPDETRYTLIDPDGAVIFDSEADPSAMDNHADRPEVRQAEESGEAVTARYSDTLDTDTIYAAVLLDDGNVVRLSETRHSLVAFLGGMMVPLLLAVVVAGAAVFVLSRVLTRRIMKPIDALDFKDPLENDIYEEMAPLLTRIDEQQRQLKKQNRELAEAESMRRDFSSNVSHEMKTPLQVISGYAELMKNDLVLPGDRQKFAGLIYDEAQAMRSLINDVLTLSKLDESAFGAESTPIDLHAVAERMQGRLASFAKEREVTIEVSGEPARIVGSETLAEEMLYNLIENGIRYNRPGGVVRVRTSVEDGAGAGGAAGAVAGAGGAAGAGAGAGAGGVAGARQACVVVSDTGAGVPADMLDKIFERFFRVDKSRSKETGGTGLGLAIVKHAVIYHHGTIAVESEEGHGTTFTLRIPAA